MPYMTQAFVSQVYTTNGEVAVDAHVVGLIGPSAGITAAAASNIVLTMANSLGVSNSAYSSNFVGRVITNQFNQGIDITNPASRSFYRFNTNGTFAVTQPDSSSGHLAWDGVSGTTLYLAGTNGPNAAAFMTFQSITEVLPRMLTAQASYTDAMIIQKQGLDPVILFTDGGADNVLSLGDSSLCSQDIELWVKHKIDFGSNVNGQFANNLDLRIDIDNALLIDGDLNNIIDFKNHNFYATDGTIFYTGGTTHLFRGNGASITNINGATFTGSVLNTTNGTVRIGTTVGNHLVNITSASNDVVAINSTGTDSASMLHIRNLTVQGPFFSFESAPQNWGWGLSALGSFVLRNSPTNTDPVNGTTRFSIDTNGVTHADGSGITNTIIFDRNFASATNALTLNNGRWLLQSATPGSLTNITVAAPYTWATLVVSNSSATTNTFLISAAARYFGLVSTNLIQVYPGKMAYISIDALANVWTNICTVTQQ